MKTLRAPIIFLFVVCLFSNINAKMPITYLRDLVEQAHWIVIGEVVTIEDRPDILDQFGFPVKIAKIKPYKFFKGAQASEFSFKFNDLWADQAVFALNESYLLFIEKTAKGPHVGYLGALKITNDTVSTWEIWGEPETQLLNIIIEKIKKLLEK